MPSRARLPAIPARRPRRAARSPPPSAPRRLRRRELGEIGEAERLLDRGDLLHGILEPVLAELPVLDVLEGLAGLAQLAFGQPLPPGREDDRILARRMVLIHQL